MTHNKRSLAYTLLKGIHCSNCGSKIDFNDLQLDPSTEQFAYTTEYNCECSTHYQIKILDLDDSLKALIEGPNVDPREIIDSKSLLRQKNHAVHSLVESINELHSAAFILSSNQESLEFMEKQVPEHFTKLYGITPERAQSSVPKRTVSIRLEKGIGWMNLHANIHNYLSSAYTFDQTLETIRSDLIWDQEIESEYKKYKDESRIIQGLRIYVQHGKVLPISVQFSRENRPHEIDLTVDINDINVLNSQIQEGRPDGYKHGSNHYYPDIQGKINISEKIEQHYESALELTYQISQTAYSEKKSEIEEYEKIGREGIEVRDFEQRSSPYQPHY